MTISISPLTSRKQTTEELKEAGRLFTSIIPENVITQTLAVYTGFQAPVDYKVNRPVNFIGPLEHELLPDSEARRVIWLAHLHFNKEDVTKYLESIPNIDISKRVIFPELISFASEQAATKKNCFDEAFKDNAYYKKNITTLSSYGKMRSLAFETRDAIKLLKLMGYREVSKASKGDLIVYFSHSKASGTNSFPSFSPTPKPSHYGTIVNIEKDGTIKVRSRFNYSHIYQHNIDLIPYFYGSSYLIFSNNSQALA